MYTPGLAQHLQDLNLLKCEHNHQHSGKAGGVKSHGVWNSAAAAAYPAELNLWIAQAIAHLATAHRDVQPHRLVAKRMGGSDNIIHEADHSPLPSMARVEPSSLYPTSNPTHPMSTTAHPQPSVDPMPPPHSPATSKSPRKQPWWYTDPSKDVVSRRTRSSTGHDNSNLFASAMLSLYEGSCSVGNAFVVQSSDVARVDPKNHDEAMVDDSEGWLEAESTELKNHEANGSFTLLDRNEFERVAPTRRLVKLVWVFKRKRNGKKKARLCVQGCSQQPGVDYDQTHCGTMRGTSLRMLTAIAGQHDMFMRRWDFVSAFLQGDLETVSYTHLTLPTSDLV